MTSGGRKYSDRQVKQCANILLLLSKSKQLSKVKVLIMQNDPVHSVLISSDILLAYYTYVAD